MYSSIKGINIKVTSTEIAVALKCNNEHPPKEDHFVAEPPMLTVVDIIRDMCGGQYVDGHCNARSKTKMPPQL